MRAIHLTRIFFFSHQIQNVDQTVIQEQHHYLLYLGRLRTFALDMLLYLVSLYY